MTRIVTRWEPFRDMVSLRDAMNHLMEESLVRPRWSQERDGGATEPALRLPIDVYTTAEEIVISAPVPGVAPDKVEITVEGDTLTIRGEIPAPLENVNYVMQERAFGGFSRTLVMNVPVQAEKATAEFQNGVLTITVPKADVVKPHTIKVAAK